MTTTTKTLEVLEAAKRLAFFAIDPALSAGERAERSKAIFAMLGDLGAE
jgi:hypothetical protein